MQPVGCKDKCTARDRAVLHVYIHPKVILRGCISCLILCLLALLVYLEVFLEGHDHVPTDHLGDAARVSNSVTAEMPAHGGGNMQLAESTGTSEDRAS